MRASQLSGHYAIDPVPGRGADAPATARRPPGRSGVAAASPTRRGGDVLARSAPPDELRRRRGDATMGRGDVITSHGDVTIGCREFTPGRRAADRFGAAAAGGPRIVAVGVSHHHAPVELRERLAHDVEGLREQLCYLCDEICDEAMIVSTCNRFELYAVVSDAAMPALRSWWHGLAGSSGEAGWRQVHEYEHGAAVAHLFRVASSLDSLVLGEPQILGQVKDAVSLAASVGALGPTLDRLARHAIEVAKRVRSETAIGRARVGVGNAGVELARQIFGRLDGKKALLVGVGAIGRQVAKALLAAGIDQLTVTNRTFAKAAELAAECCAAALPLDQLDTALGDADIVITATASATPLVSADAVQRALAGRRGRELLCIDLAVPRNIEAAVASLAGARLCNVDDLDAVVERGRAARSAACSDALAIVDQETASCLEELRERAAGPEIGRITQVADALRRRELARYPQIVATLTPEQGELFEAMSRALANKLLDGPLRAIRAAAREGDQAGLQRLLAQWDRLERRRG